MTAEEQHTTAAAPEDTSHANGSTSSTSWVSMLKTPAWALSERKTSWRDVFTTKTIFGWPPEDSGRETAWLDGLRGVAAFLVMIYHYGLVLWFPLSFEAPFGARVLDDTRQEVGDRMLEFWRLPFFRVYMDSGHAQVSVFFVLSGFVLSWGPIGAIKNGQIEKFGTSLGSATFRRWLRLYLPCFAIAFWECIEIFMGWREHPKAALDNFFAQFWDYLKADEKFANPFDVKRTNWSALHEYDYTMWTIPFEFSGSLVVFVTLLAVSRFKHFGKRSTIMFLLVAYACYKAEWTYWLFLSGMLIANYVRHMGGFKKLSERQNWFSLIAWSLVLLVSILLAGNPEPSEFYSRPGYSWLDSMVSNEWKPVEGGGRLWWCWSGILFILAASHLSAVRNLFDKRITRYLGRVSYMLYLTHRVGLNLVGQPLKWALFKVWERGLFIDDLPPNAEPGLMHGLSTFLLYVIWMAMIVPFSIWVAHWVTLFVDDPSVKFAKWVEDYLKKGGGRWDGEPSSSGRREEGAGLLPSHSGDVALHEQEMGVIHPAARKDVEEQPEVVFDHAESGEGDGLLDPSHFEMTELPPRSEDDHSKPHEHENYNPV